MAAMSFNGRRQDSSYTASPGALRRFVQSRKLEVEQAAVEHCDLCNNPLAKEHRHLLKLSDRSVLCACNACALLFVSKGAGGEKFVVVPRRYLVLPDFHIAEEQWEELMLPVNLIYIFQSSVEKRAMAFYPSPAGAMESLLSPESWELLGTNNPVLAGLEADVEALLINRVGEQEEYFIVPIDICYQLVGLMRMKWRGLNGGEAVWKTLEEFFTGLRLKAIAQAVGDMSPVHVKGELDAGPEF